MAEGTELVSNLLWAGGRFLGSKHRPCADEVTNVGVLW